MFRAKWACYSTCSIYEKLYFRRNKSLCSCITKVPSFRTLMEPMSQQISLPRKCVNGRQPTVLPCDGLKDGWKVDTPAGFRFSFEGYCYIYLMFSTLFRRVEKWVLVFTS
ncbi:hypothetical protein RvY_12374-5 [Ramazzottius varieornatus]|uniref:Uncharacterized protein n=1 Tax=Ramazzottius varieornatus TaxID=947166 RepID=A0A1D1VLB5_RAMVA|nr:hypothetical protein RvY_12374-5 [Ramazzottius varieornatus]